MDVEIISHSHYPAADPKRIGQEDTVVLFRVDGRRVDSLLIQGKVDDAKQIEAAIAARVKSSAKIAGHKFTIPG